MRLNADRLFLCRLDRFLRNHPDVVIENLREHDSLCREHFDVLHGLGLHVAGMAVLRKVGAFCRDEVPAIVNLVTLLAALRKKLLVAALKAMRIVAIRTADAFAFRKAGAFLQSLKLIVGMYAWLLVRPHFSGCAPMALGTESVAFGDCDLARINDVLCFRHPRICPMKIDMLPALSVAALTGNAHDDVT